MICADRLAKAGGMEAETSYPYKGIDGNCNFNRSKVVAHISSWRYCTLFSTWSLSLSLFSRWPNTSPSGTSLAWPATRTAPCSHSSTRLLLSPSASMPPAGSCTTVRPHGRKKKNKKMKLPLTLLPAGGVLRTCGQSIDHCVQITGFSTVNGLPVWNVRNSWGADWVC